MALKALILSGGAGTRLWPVSRALYPKQLLRLFGNKTLVQQTFLRLKKLASPKDIYIATNPNFKEDIFLQLRKLGLVKENILIEPSQKNTAPAIAFGTQKILEKDKEAIILVSPIDHFIKPDSKFVKDVKTALVSARNGFLVTFGIKPTGPSSEYGYIGLKERNKKEKIFAVKRFTEKPDQKEAEQLLKEGYLWNSGTFIWKGKAIMSEIDSYLPKVKKALKSKKAYEALQAVSIDKGVLEFSKKVRVVPASFKWQDIGSWKTLYQILPKDSAKNILSEKVLESDCHNCLISGTPKRLITAIGLENLVVVDTEDAVLVSHMDKTGEIKKLLGEMKKNNFPQYLKHPTIHRPWGDFTTIEEGDNFKVKKVSINPGQKMSLQFHNRRSEHWVILKGLAKVELNGKKIMLQQHQSIDVPLHAKHRLENAGRDILEIIEIQSGKYLEDDDIVRIEDKYKRLEI